MKRQRSDSHGARRLGQQRRAVVGLAAGTALAAAGGAAQAAQLTTNWAAPVNGNWIDTTPVRWDNGIPSNGANTFNANIAVGGSAYTVTLNSPITIDNLTLNSASATLSHNAGTLTVNGTIALSAGTYSLAGGTIANSTINATVPLVLTPNGGNQLNHVTVNGDLSFPTVGAQVVISNGTTFTTAHLANDTAGIGFAPGQTLSGTIQFEGAAGGTRAIEMNGTAGTFTVGATGVIKIVSGSGGNGQIGAGTNFGGAMTLVNNGFISSEAAGRTITINPAGGFTNTGMVQAIPGNIALNTTSVSNSGTLGATSVSLTGDFTNSGSGAAVLRGTQTWSNGSLLQLNGGSVTLAGNPGSNTAYNLIANVTPAAGNATLSVAGSPVDLVQLRDLRVNGVGAGGAGLVIIGPAATGASANPTTHFGSVGGSVAVYLGNGTGTFGFASRATVENLWKSAALEGFWALQNHKVTAITRGLTLAPGVVTDFNKNGLVVIPSIDNANNPVTYVGEDIQGDTNGDGVVDINDLGPVLQHLNTTPGLVAGEGGFTVYTPREGDVNGDLKVDVNDLGTVLANLNQSYAPASSEGGVSSIPEPASAMLMTLGAVALLRRRRR